MKIFKRKVNKLRQLTNIVILIIDLGLVSHIANAQSISSAELINDAKRYDEKVIHYKGEIIGDVMKRGSHTWINVTDGQNAIGIWVDYPSIKNITYTGSYKTRGDKVELTGIFHRACIEHGGDLDIHAQSVTKITSGSQIHEELDFNKINIAVISSGILVILFLWNLLIRKNSPPDNP